MPFLKHLDELRKRMFVVVGVVIVVTVIGYFFTDPVYKFVMAPVLPVLKGNSPIAIGVLDPMTLRFGLAFWAAIVVTSPIIMWQLMGFLLPALRPQERKFVLPTFAAMVVLFAAGCALCYTLILPASFGWLAGQSGTIMAFMPQASDMLAVVEFFLLAFGIAFQTPIIVFYLVYFGVVPYKTLRSNWRVIYMVLITVACLVTPDWSPVSMGGLAIALLLLYELSMVACRLMLRGRIKRQAAEAEEALA